MGKKHPPKNHNKPTNQPLDSSLTALYHIHIKSLTSTLKNSVKSSWSKLLQKSYLLTILYCISLSSASTLPNSFLSCFISPIHDLKMKSKMTGFICFSVYMFCHCNIFPTQYRMTNRPIFTLENPRRCSLSEEGWLFFIFILFLLFQFINVYWRRDYSNLRLTSSIIQVALFP